jgi:sugar phosphate permease
MPNSSAVAENNIGVLTPAHRYWRWNILLSTYFAYAGFYLCRKVYSSVKPVINKPIAEGGLGLDWDQIANIWMAFLIAYMLGQFITSFLGRKWAPKTLLVGGLGLSMIVNCVFGFANTYWTFLIFMVFNGFLQSTGWPSSVGAVAHWIRPQERGIIMGAWSTSHIVGTLVVKGVAALLIGYLGWRWSFWGATMLASLLWAMLLWRHHDKPEDLGLAPLVIPAQDNEADIQEEGGEHLSLAEYFRLALHPAILMMGLAYLCVKFLRYALDSWLPTFFVTQMHVSADMATYWSTVYDICGILPAVLAGWALDRFFRGNWAMLCLVAAVGMVSGFVIALTFHGSVLAVALGYGVIGFMIFGPETLLSGAASVQVAGEKNGLAVAGIVNGIGSIGPILQEWRIGKLMKESAATGMQNTNIMCLCLCIFFLLFMIVAAWLRRRAIARKAAQKTDA